MVCDDHRLFLEAVVCAFTAMGHEVVAFTTRPHEAVELVVSHQPDVCLVDLTFPDGRGLDVVRAVREQAPDVKILVLSGAADADTAWNVLQSGAHGFVGKDQPVGRVFEALEELERGQFSYDVMLLRGARAPSRTEDREHNLVRSLTNREREVLTRLVRAQTTVEIARGMGITTSTARAYVQTVLTKLGVHSRVQAVTLVAHAGPDNLRT